MATCVFCNEEIKPQAIDPCHGWSFKPATGLYPTTYTCHAKCFVDAASEEIGEDEYLEAAETELMHTTGYVHRRASSDRCQRRIVSGRTNTLSHWSRGSVRAKAAMNIRSAGPPARTC